MCETQFPRPIRGSWDVRWSACRGERMSPIERWIRKLRRFDCGGLSRGTRGGEGRQTGAGAAAALTHGPHSQPPPTSLCSSEKKALLFSPPEQGGEEGLSGEPPLSSATPADIRKEEGEKKKRKEGRGPDFPPLSGVLSTHSRFSTQTQAGSLR